MIRVWFAAGAERFTVYEAPLRKAFADAGLTVEMSARYSDPGAVDYIIYAPEAGAEPQDFSVFSQARAVLSLWAGVEKIISNPSLVQPLCRMVDDGLTRGMVEWVCGHVLRHHLGMDRHIVNPQHRWEPAPPPLATDRPIAMLGLGALGQAAAQALAGLGFPVFGWSRSGRHVEGLAACHGGEEGLRLALEATDIVVTLLPLTPDTENLLDARRLAWMRRGAVLLNPGRGALIDDAALLQALDTGHLAHATLDVFRTEPLPGTHPFWSHPRVTVTPHVAAETRPASAARVIAENIRRGEAGLTLLHLVDKRLGY